MFSIPLPTQASKLLSENIFPQKKEHFGSQMLCNDFFFFLAKAGFQTKPN